MNVTPHEALDSNSIFSQVSALDRKDPKKVGGMFESMFFRQMFETMQLEQEDDPVFGSSEMRNAQQMFYDQVANEMGQKGELGIGKMIEAEMTRNAKAQEARGALGLLK